MYKLYDKHHIYDVPVWVCSDPFDRSLWGELGWFIRRVYNEAVANKYDAGLLWQYNQLMDKLVQLCRGCRDGKHEELLSTVVQCRVTFDQFRYDEAELAELCGVLSGVLYTIR